MMPQQATYGGRSVRSIGLKASVVVHSGMHGTQVSQRLRTGTAADAGAALWVGIILPTVLLGYTAMAACQRQ